MNKVYEGHVLIMDALAQTEVGDVIVFEDSIGVAQTSGAVGEPISVDTVGVYAFNGANADAIKVGDILYWDETNKVVTINSNTNANTRAGISWSVKASNTDGIVNVKIG